MEYNSVGINRLLEVVGMQVEIERLIQAGLTYSQLTEVFDSLFNPKSDKRLEWFCQTVLKVDGLNVNVDQIDSNYLRFRLYYSIGTDRVYTFREIGEEQGITSPRARVPSQRFEDIVGKKGVSQKDLSKYRRKYRYKQQLRSAEAERNRTQRVSQLKREIYYRSLEKICSS